MAADIAVRAVDKGIEALDKAGIDATLVDMYSLPFDGDGILDVDDRCPGEPEDMDGFQDEDGCPDPDNDLDGFPDDRDRCPTEAGGGR